MDVTSLNARLEEKDLAELRGKKAQERRHDEEVMRKREGAWSVREERIRRKNHLWLKAAGRLSGGAARGWRCGGLGSEGGAAALGEDDAGHGRGGSSPSGLGRRGTRST